ncbi:holo-ACP synthase [Helicobacter sp. 12S02634-8]|uniref:holo-ACP synthase n=1 Tax=Helicobacter sp. 12S02634-8 TaxID=1476199 RepID=UPI000BA728F3|nr:holo-ACP synthase [Helicobacter sp. 12S02634-8]PAF47072.1 holo-ACP synthase [Helicobacter sp. 12S02634-8]
MIGIDIVSICRIQANLERYKESFLQRFLRPEEIALITTPKGYKASSVAGFWAAKEACAKALGVGISEELRFFDICLSKTPRNAPLISLCPQKMQFFNIQSIDVSITHDGGFALAAVIIESAIKKS